MKKLSLILLVSLFCVKGWAQAGPKVTLTWSAPTTHTSGAQIPTGTVIFYQVLRGKLLNLSDLAEVVKDVSTTTYIDTSVAPLTQYYYVVRAYFQLPDFSGNSPVAPTVTKPAAGTKPDQVGTLTTVSTAN